MPRVAALPRVVPAPAPASVAALPGPPWRLTPDPMSAAPVYVQLAQGWRERIEGGSLPGGAAFPAERELARLLGVSRVTVRQALALLEDEGLLRRKQGSGTFVEAPRSASRPLGLLSSFTDEVRARGARPGAQVLRFENALPTPHEALTLGLAPTERVYRVRRLRSSDGEALAVEESTLPAALIGPLSPEDVTDASLYALLGARGVQPARAVRHLRALNAEAELAGLLGVEPGAALLATERVSWTGQGQAVEYARAWYRGDRSNFVMELRGDAE
ncbi:GntR family transcriptional regulator [Deinococcus reticulitermitis]|nr:GntR family transcriptional regulator [Deinococcus reticulitermitis]